MITDFTGKRTNTTSIARTGTNIHYSRIFPDDNGSIFSYTISDKEISLFSWK
jgi:hypothetical protein